MLAYIPKENSSKKIRVCLVQKFPNSMQKKNWHNAPLSTFLSNHAHTGFPIKDARFSKLKNIPDLLSDDKEGKSIEYID